MEIEKTMNLDTVTKLDGFSDEDFAEMTAHWTAEDFEEYEEFRTTDSVMYDLWEYLQNEYDAIGDAKLEALFQRDIELKSGK